MNKPFEGKKLLLAGVGQLNRRVGSHFFRLGGDVVGLRRSESDPALGFEQQVVDLSTEAWPDFSADFLVVALSAGSRELGNYEKTYVNSLARLTASLSGWKQRPERILVVSSSRVYGVDDGAEITDDDDAQTNDPFGKLLLQMETLCNALPTQSSALRLSGIYGPGRDWLKRQALKADTQLASDKWTNRIHIDDAAAAIIHLLQIPALLPHYIVSDLVPKRQSEMFNYFREANGLSPVSAREGSLSGKRLLPTTLQASGFQWRYPDAFSGGYEL